MKARMAAALAAAALIATAQAGAQTPADAPVAAPASVNVRACGAVGDGKADDTAAFQAAITQAAKAGVSVFVPRGVYNLSKPLALTNLAITGPEGSAWNADIDTLPILVPTHRDGPCITLDAGGALRGICIRYNWQAEPTDGPPAVLVRGIGAFVSCVKIMYPWNGIMTDGVNNVGRFNVENVFIVSPRNIGVRVTGTWDVPALRNVEVWNAGPVPRPLDKGIGFDLGKNDLIRLSDCFAFAMGTGFLLRDEIPGCKIRGGTWGTMANCATDFCGIGISVQGENTISVAGGTFWDHGTGVLVKGSKARVRVTGAEFRSNGAPALEVTSADHVTVSGCSLLRLMREHKAPAVLAEGGRVLVNGCVIESASDGIVIGPRVAGFAQAGCTIEAAAGKPTVDRRAKPKAR